MSIFEKIRIEVKTMDKSEAIAYACVAIKQLLNDGVEITEKELRLQMLFLMEAYTEIEIYQKYCDGKY